MGEKDLKTAADYLPVVPPPDSLEHTFENEGEKYKACWIWEFIHGKASKCHLLYTRVAG